MITKKCKTCGKEFKVFPYRKDTAEYCSMSCQKKTTGIGNTNGFKKGQIPKNNGIKNPGVGGRKKGGTPWNKGIPMKESSKKLLSDKKKGKHYSPLTQFIKGSLPWNKGKNQIATTGENNCNWKGGVTKENEKKRKALEYKLWHKACLERDSFTCQKSGQKGGKLQVHHIHNFADYPELRTSIENGITLSYKSHREFHKKYGFKNNTKEQLIEFLTLS
jgi:hypothetical protein